MEVLRKLQQDQKTISKEKYLILLRKFIANANHAGPPAKIAGAEIARIMAEIAREKPPTPAPENPRQELDQTRMHLLSGNTSLIKSALGKVTKHGRSYAELIPQVKLLAKTSSKSRIRGMALLSLARIAPLVARNIAILQLRDRNEGVRLAAINYLQTESVTISMPHLRRMFSDGPGYDPSPKVIRAAKNALSIIRTGKQRHGAK